MSTEYPQVIRGAVLEFFYAREALPQMPDVIHRGLHREGQECTLALVQESIRFLTDEGFLEPVPNPLGGKVTHWRITSKGKKIHEACLSL